MTTPGDESRTELAWREIVEHYGDRPVLDDDAQPEPPAGAPRTTEPGRHRQLVEPVEETDEETDEVATVDRFLRRLPPPPFPTPRTWQRGLAWSGIFVASRARAG